MQTSSTRRRRNISSVRTVTRGAGQINDEGRCATSAQSALVRRLKLSSRAFGGVDVLLLSGQQNAGRRRDDKGGGRTARTTTTTTTLGCDVGPERLARLCTALISRGGVPDGEPEVLVRTVDARGKETLTDRRGRETCRRRVGDQPPKRIEPGDGIPVPLLLLPGSQFGPSRGGGHGHAHGHGHGEGRSAVPPVATEVVERWRIRISPHAAVDLEAVRPSSNATGGEDGGWTHRATARVTRGAGHMHLVKLVKCVSDC